MSVVWVCDKCVDLFQERLTTRSLSDRTCGACGTLTNWKELNAISKTEAVLYTVEVKNADGETVIQGFHLGEDMANQMAGKYGGTVTAEKPEHWPGVAEVLA